MFPHVYFQESLYIASIVYTRVHEFEVAVFNGPFDIYNSKSAVWDLSFIKNCAILASYTVQWKPRFSAFIVPWNTEPVLLGNPKIKAVVHSYSYFWL